MIGISRQALTNWMARAELDEETCQKVKAGLGVDLIAGEGETSQLLNEPSPTYNFKEVPGSVMEEKERVSVCDPG